MRYSFIYKVPVVQNLLACSPSLFEPTAILKLKKKTVKNLFFILESTTWNNAVKNVLPPPPCSKKTQILSKILKNNEVLKFFSRKTHFKFWKDMLGIRFMGKLWSAIMLCKTLERNCTGRFPPASETKIFVFPRISPCPNVFTYISSSPILLTWIGQNKQKSKKVDDPHNTCRGSDPKTIWGQLVEHLNIWNSHSFVIPIRTEN